MLGLVLAIGCVRIATTRAPDERDWPITGDPENSRYSPLTQIDRGNVGRLEVAWVYRTGEAGGRASQIQATPIRWIFDTIPQPGEFGYDTWPADAWRSVPSTSTPATTSGKFHSANSPSSRRRACRPPAPSNTAGRFVTAGGVLFIAATQDEKFRAFDKRTGALLWETALPAAGYATPTTYYDSRAAVRRDRGWWGKARHQVERHVPRLRASTLIASPAVARDGTLDYFRKGRRRKTPQDPVRTAPASQRDSRRPPC